MPMTDYLKKALLDEAVGKTAFTMPATYVCLFTAAPAASGTDWTDEMTADDATAGYARIAISGAEWAAAIDGASITTTTGGDVTFTATGDWSAPCLYMGLADGGTRAAGNLLFYDDITASLLVTDDTLAIAVGGIVIRLT